MASSLLSANKGTRLLAATGVANFAFPTVLVNIFNFKTFTFAFLLVVASPSVTHVDGEEDEVKRVAVHVCKLWQRVLPEDVKLRSPP